MSANERLRYVVVIRTAGNQRYIFSSNKRQEIVGASDLIARVDGAWATDALDKEFSGFDPQTWRVESHDAELLVAGAGGITVLVKEQDAGRRLVTLLTGRALAEAPGLDVCGVVIEYGPGGLAQAYQDAQRELVSVRESRPGPKSRFLRLPIVEDCRSVGLSAEISYRECDDERPQPRSAEAAAKLRAFRPALKRLAGDANTDLPAMQTIVETLGMEAEWVAVVHADGNDLGKLFRSVQDLAAGNDRRFADSLRNLSSGVDECARDAFRLAKSRTVAELGIPEAQRSVTKENLPVLPLVLGGDDLTVVCGSEVALPFTRHYLEAFEETTARVLKPVLEKLGRIRLEAAAGVAIVKRNYPFHFAYELAGQLTDEEAKSAKEHGSALAFGVLFESAAADLGRIRNSVTLSGGAGGSASPYIVGAGRSRDGWTRGRRWADLERRVAALRRKDAGTGTLLLPSGAVHDLREGLCLGREVAEARFELLRRRFKGAPERLAALEDLGEGGLVWRVGDPENANDGRDVTGLLDAMAALPFLPDKDVPEGPRASAREDALVRRDPR